MKTSRNLSCLLLLCGLLAAVPSSADNAKGIAYYKTGQLKSAKSLFLQNLSDPAAQMAETCYYLGEISFAEHQADSASAYFARGIEADPAYLPNYIGQAQLWAGTDYAGAAALIDEKVLAGKNRKDAFLQLAVARALYDADCAKYTEYLEAARRLDEKLPGIYILEGDVLAALKKYGESASKYEQAIYVDPKNSEAYFKYAHIYSDINPDLALDMLKRLLEVDPGSAIARREMAEIYYTRGDFAKAAQMYSQYIESDMHLTTDQTRYATILFFNKEYERSLEIADGVLARDPDNFVMQRLKMYNQFELKRYPEAAAAGQRFMKERKSPTGESIPLDYIYYGRILRENKQEADAILQLSKALEMDTSKVDLYKELAPLYERQNDYPKALACYRAFIARAGKDAKVADRVMLGQSAYFAASADTLAQDSLLRRGYLMTADSAFAEVAERVPDNYLGYFWRARTQASLDPETAQGLAKPYYEQAVAILEKTGTDIRKIIECYSYLGYYDYLKGDIEASKVCWNKILALEPDNQVAQNALKGLK